MRENYGNCGKLGRSGESAYKEQHLEYAYKNCLKSYYKLGQRGITNWVSFDITNWGKRVLQIGAAFLLQIRARFITN